MSESTWVKDTLRDQYRPVVNSRLKACIGSILLISAGLQLFTDGIANYEQDKALKTHGSCDELQLSQVTTTYPAKVVASVSFELNDDAAYVSTDFDFDDGPSQTGDMQGMQTANATHDYTTSGWYDETVFLSFAVAGRTVRVTSPACHAQLFVPAMTTDGY